MGLETYLFRLFFFDLIESSKVINVFKNSGLTLLSQEEFSNSVKYLFECRTQNGLTELLCYSKNNLIKECNIRFSILSPRLVIEQTFGIFKNIAESIPFKIMDTEIYNQLFLDLSKSGKVNSNFELINSNELKEDIEQKSYIPNDVENFKLNVCNVKKRELILKNDTGVIIESGDKTINYISKNKLVDKFFGWVGNFVKK